MYAKNVVEFQNDLGLGLQDSNTPDRQKHNRCATPCPVTLIPSRVKILHSVGHSYHGKYLGTGAPWPQTSSSIGGSRVLTWTGQQPVLLSLIR